jgi:DNA-binding NarL/FixJ family response regulator
VVPFCKKILFHITGIKPNHMTRKGPARCVIVEDQRMFAELLATLLQASPDIDLEVAAAVASVTGGIAACELHRPDLLLLDIGLPNGSRCEFWRSSRTVATPRSAAA